MADDVFTKTERRAAASLALVFGQRMFGLFLLLPVIAIHAESLAGATPFLVGIAVGIYGLSQAALQIPFGAASDKVGRKPMMTIGLGLFLIGSVTVAVADDIAVAILGRVLQGAGAIAAVGLALASDLTRDHQRTKMMAILGVTIGASFILALICAPILQGWIGVRGILWITAALALGAIITVWAVVPAAPAVSARRAEDAQRLVDAMSAGKLWMLYLVIFVLHMSMTLIFVAVPMMLLSRLQFPVESHWQVYLPATLISVLFMLPVLRMARQASNIKHVLLIALSASALGLAVIAGLEPSIILVGIGLTFYFAGFNTLEALLPSLVSRIAPARLKGAALGVFSSSSFFGAFVGGGFGGYIAGAYGLQTACVFALVSILLLGLLIVVSDNVESSLATNQS